MQFTALFFFWLICLISEHTLYKYLIPKMLGKLPAEFNAIIFSHKICVEIRLFSSKLSQFLCSVNYHYLTRTETSSQVVHPHFFRPGTTHLQLLQNVTGWLTCMHVYIDTHTRLSFQQQSVSQGSGNFQLPDGFTWEEWELMEKDGQGHGQDIDSWVRELKFLEF